MRVMTVALIMSILGCAVFAYLWIDRSISLGYARHSADASSDSARRLERLLASAWSGMPESTVLENLQAEAARHPNENIVVKKEAETIWFDEIEFNFEHGKLQNVNGR